MEGVEVDEKLLEAFHLMYDHFPEPVMLSHKSRLVMAANPVCVKMGRKPGMICAKLGTGLIHKGCQAAKTVAEHKAVYKMAGARNAWGEDFISFWLPIDGYPDFYVHFAVGSTVNYKDTPAGIKVDK